MMRFITSARDDIFYRMSAAMLDLYHGTSPANAQAIVQSGQWQTNYGSGELYFSTDPRSNYISGFGTAVVHVRVPENIAAPEDEFPNGEMHYTINMRDMRPNYIVGVM
jgi:hypothetical protein